MRFRALKFGRGDGFAPETTGFSSAPERTNRHHIPNRNSRAPAFVYISDNELGHTTCRKRASERRARLEILAVAKGTMLTVQPGV